MHYRSEWATELAAKTKREERAAANVGKNVVIIGGRVKWIQKLKLLF